MTEDKKVPNPSPEIPWLINKETFRIYIEDQIREQNAKALTVDWVLWMLKTLGECGENTLNPAWLEASHRIRWAYGYSDSEPPMIYE